MRRKKFSSPRIWAWVVAITVVAALCLWGIYKQYSNKLKPALETQLKELVIASTDSLYSIQYSYLNLNPVTGNATVKDLKLIPNQSVYKKLLAQKKAPDNLFDLSVENVVIRQFHPKRLYSDKKLNINTIIIDNPTLTITNHPLPYNNDEDNTKPKSLYQVISKVFTEIRIDKILLQDIDFTLINTGNSRKKKTAIKNLNINATDLLIDSLSENDRSRFYHSKNIAVKLKSYRIATSDGLYFIDFNNLSFSSSDKQLLLDKVSVIPRYSKLKHYEKAGFAKDRYDIGFTGISINKINLNRFLRDQTLYAGNMIVKKARVEVYNNMAYKRNMENKTGRFPHQQLQKLALNVRIDVLNIRNALISYSEYNPDSKRTGTITFNNTSAKFSNLTNDSASLKKNHFMKASLTSRFMDAGRFETSFNFNLTDTKGAFSCTGTLYKIDGTVLNNITKPLGLIEIKRADVKKLTFHLKANNTLATGTMQFYYSNLNVQVLKRDEETGKLETKGFLSQIANIFVVHENNPNFRGDFTPGTIYYKRPYYASFFSFLWKSLFTGIKESVGVSSKKERKIKNTASKIGGFLQKLKEKHEENKAEREERRAERRKEREEKKAEKEEKKKEQETEEQDSLKSN
ncbi:hypothetical protein [Rubrolithibacter danxiaensis]|uniref:hypothetical protein n=1 Tax=Rubrolithibacter danxiaensis TaxID=3390805 RepID=UPI003BF8ABB0